MKERAKQLAADHTGWVEGYTKELGLTMIPVAAALYLYRTATIHGYGHGVEDECNGNYRTLDPLDLAMLGGGSLLDITLPSITVEGNEALHYRKYLEETKEWQEAERGSLAEAIEAWDVLQAAQTWSEHEADGVAASAIRDAIAALTRYHEAGRDVMKAKRIMLVKNAGRSRYSAEDNAMILEAV